MKIQWRKDSISINDVGKPGQPHAKKKKKSETRPLSHTIHTQKKNGSKI